MKDNEKGFKKIVVLDLLEKASKEGNRSVVRRLIHQGKAANLTDEEMFDALKKGVLVRQ